MVENKWHRICDRQRYEEKPYTSTKIKRSSPGQYRVAKITCLYICICNNHVKMCAKNNKDPQRVHYYLYSEKKMENHDSAFLHFLD